MRVSRLAECLVQGDERLERPITCKTPESVKRTLELISEDRCRTVHHLCYGICQEIITENLNMHRIAVKFVSLLEQKQRRLDMCLEFHEKGNDVPRPPYSLDVTPRDCVLFLKMKLKLNGRRFDIISDMEAVLDGLRDRDLRV